MLKGPLAMLAFFVFANAALAQESSGGLRVDIRPDAAMTVVPVNAPSGATLNARWFHIRMAVRLNANTNAVLSAEIPTRTTLLIKAGETVKEQSARASVPLFVTHKSGFHWLVVGFPKETIDSARFHLRSSDGAIAIAHPVRSSGVLECALPARECGRAVDELSTQVTELGSRSEAGRE